VVKNVGNSPAENIPVESGVKGENPHHWRTFCLLIFTDVDDYLDPQESQIKPVKNYGFGSYESNVHSSRD